MSDGLAACLPSQAGPGPADAMSDNRRLCVVMYHYTRDLAHSRYPRIKGLDIALFKEQISFFKAKFNAVTMERVIESMNGGRELPERPLLLTFDDGYADNYDFAFPVLKENGMQGSFYVSGKTFTDHELLDVNKIHFILASGDSLAINRRLRERMDYYRGREYDYPSNEELSRQYVTPKRYDGPETVFIKQMLQNALPEPLRHRIASELLEEYVGVSEEVLSHELYLTRDQIRLMRAEGMHIGIHGYDHYSLGLLPADKARADIERALEVMDEFIDRDSWTMNFPYGSYNEGVLDFVKSKGAVLGFSTRVGFARLGADPVLELPRLNCNDFPPKSETYKEFL